MSPLRSPHGRRRLPLLACALALVLGAPGRAQDAALPAPDAQAPAAPPVPAPPTAADVERRLAELDAGADLAEDVRADARRLWEQTRARLEEAAKLRDQARESERAAAEAPALLASLQAELAAPPAPPSLDDLSGADLQRLESERARAEAELAAAQKELHDLQAEAGRRDQLKVNRPAQIAEKRQELANLDAEVLSAQAADPAGAGPRDEAARAERLARRDKLAAELRAYESELASIEARKELLPKRRERAARRVGQAQARVDALAALVAERRQLDAQATQRETAALQERVREQAPGAAELQELARENEALAAERSGPRSPGARAEEKRREAAALKAQVAEWRSRFEGTVSKVRVAGLSTAISRILRSHYEKLPDGAELARRQRELQNEVSEEEYNQILREEDGDRFRDTERAVQELLQRIGAPESGAQRDEVAAVARNLIGQRRKLLDDLDRESDDFLAVSRELDEALRELSALGDAYRGYIEERILFVRSVEADTLIGTLPRPADTWQALTWLLSPAGWAEALSRTVRDPAPWLRAVPVWLLAAALWVARPLLRRRLERFGDLVVRYRTDRLVLTARCTALTLLVAAPVPATLWIAGWSTDQLLGSTVLARAAATGLRSAGAALALPVLLIAIARRKGLGEAHFRWAAGPSRGLRVELRWLTSLIAPLVFLHAVFGASENEAWRDSAGRTAFVVHMLVLAAFARRTAAPSRAVMSEVLRRNAGGWLDRTRAIWYPAALLFPAGLAAIALFGYYYTAEKLYELLARTLLFVAGVVLLNAFLHRWLFMVRRRLAVEQARARSLARAEARDAPGAAVATESGSLPEDESVDIPALDERTRQLFRSGVTVGVALGLYFIWGNVLPALRGLERVVVYPSFEVRSAEDIEEEHPLLAVPGGAAKPRAERTEPAGTGGNGSGGLLPSFPKLGSSDAAPSGAEGGAEARELRITLADLVLSVLVLILTAIAAINFPALLEMALLQQLPLDSGGRYAVTTITRYAITIAGVSSAAGALGIGWTEIQWLAAALTFGLAFGLQEIFANFVSGLIILAERPVRIGDIVTVSGVEGKVTRIRMRATLITDWDRRELLVPNKDFITGQLINWTLTDPITRIVVPVGIAYGSDTKRARDLLLECAKRCTYVLSDPGPAAIFRAFGESSLNFELRVFLGNRDQWPQVVHELHTSIDDAFRKAGIEIAFPQRDLHVRSISGLQEALGRRD